METQSLEGEAFLYQNLIIQYKPVSKIHKTSWVVPSGEVSVKVSDLCGVCSRASATAMGIPNRQSTQPEMWNMYVIVIWNMYVVIRNCGVQETMDTLHYYFPLELDIGLL